MMHVYFQANASKNGYYLSSFHNILFAIRLIVLMCISARLPSEAVLR